MTRPSVGIVRLPMVHDDPTVVPNITVDESARTAARQKLLLVQSAGVYEQGNLVAIIVPESAK